MLNIEWLKMTLRLRLPVIYDMLVELRRGTDFSRIRFERHLKNILNNTNKKGKEIMVVQVGSNDGTGDIVSKCIRQNGYSALLIEPVPTVFNRLVNNYKGIDNILFCNSAVADAQGILPFFMVSPRAVEELGDRLPRWWDQIGSFDKSHINKHLGGILAPYIESIEVETRPLQEILENYAVVEIDLLHIDAEGMDHIVIRSVNFAKIRPNVIVFEHKHIHSAEKADLNIFLNELGYGVSYYRDDAIAVFN